MQFHEGIFSLSSSVANPITVEAWIYFSYSDTSKLHPLISLATGTSSQ